MNASSGHQPLAPYYEQLGSNSGQVMKLAVNKMALEHVFFSQSLSVFFTALTLNCKTDPTIGVSTQPQLGLCL
jgi:hypothetical protein